MGILIIGGKAWAINTSRIPIRTRVPGADVDDLQSPAWRPGQCIHQGNDLNTENSSMREFLN
jgi:hypothetical protein